jgi:glycine cleavage system H protein
MSPQDLLFTRDHEWIESGKSPTRIGISDYAQGELTDVVYVELPEAGAEVQKGSVIVTLESVKATSDVFSPVDGKVTAVNSDLEVSPQKINEDPYGEGWLVEIEVADPAPLEGLMDFEAYEKYLEGTGE